MIRVRLRIGDDATWDTYERWGLIYMDADERTEAPIKARATTSYAEEPGEHTDARTVQDAFDYKAKFLIECKDGAVENVNTVIARLNRAMYDERDGVRVYKEVTFYNDYNHVKITGLPEPIAEPVRVDRKYKIRDIAEVELKIRVSNPQLCDFHYHHNMIGEFAADSTEEDWYWWPNGVKTAIPVDPKTKKFSYEWAGKLTRISNLFIGSNANRSRLKSLECIPSMADALGSSYYAFSGMPEIERLPEEIDMPEITDAAYTFLALNSLKRIGEVNTPKVKSMEMVINTGGSELHTIESLDIGAITKSTMVDFQHCPAAKMYLKNFGKATLTEFFVTSPRWGNDAVVAGARDSMVRTLLTDSCDRLADGMPVATVVLHADALARLTEHEIVMMTEKGYNVTAIES